MAFSPDCYIVDDCESALKTIPDNSISMVITSPPYADQRNYGDTVSCISADNYIEWFLPKAREIFRVLKDDGSFILNINDKVVGQYQHLYVFRLLIALCDIVGFHLVRDYIWYNPATPPNVFSRGGMGRTKKSHEYCFWFSKSDKWHFDLDAIRVPYGQAMERYLRGKGKGDRCSNIRPSTHNFNCEKVWTNHGGSDPGTVIEISNTISNDVFMRLCKEKGIRHPARFPEKLVEFFIKAGTCEGDIVLDPFAGSGTTVVAAAKLKRRWVYIDANEHYCELAKERLLREMSSITQENDDDDV